MSRAFRIILLAFLAGGIAPIASCEKLPGSAANGPKLRRVAVIPPAPSNQQWAAVHTGAAAAAQEARDVLLTYRAPAVEGDPVGQAAILRELIESGPSAIVLAPADDSVLAGPLEKTREARIPVVILDRDLPAEPAAGITAVVTMDNAKGGAMAAAHLGEILKRGSVTVFRSDKSDANGGLREKGFVTEVARHAALSLIAPAPFSGTTVAEARAAADALLAKNPELAGVFCPSETAAHGMVLALRERFLNGKVKVVGFEASLFLVQAMALGDIDALVAPDPVSMGKLGVKAALDALEGKPVQARQVVEVQLATRANMHDEPMKSLLLPDLLPVLGGP